MNSNPRKNDGDDFELQPSEAERHPVSRHVAPFHTIAPVPASEDINAFSADPADPNWATQNPAPSAAAHAPAGATSAAPLDGPTSPAREKVDFENLPEFVWQRKMLRMVRIGALIITVIVTILVIMAFTGVFKGAHDSMKKELDRQSTTTDEPAP